MREEEIREILSKNIKYYRDKKGLSQMALALKAGLATNFINDIENGKKWVSPSTLSKICEALEISPYKLFIEVNFANDNCSEIINQFCSDLLNEILNSIKEISARYGKS